MVFLQQWQKCPYQAATLLASLQLKAIGSDIGLSVEILWFNLHLLGIFPVLFGSLRDTGPTSQGQMIF